jgi:hypothetical protein
VRIKAEAGSFDLIQHPARLQQISFNEPIRVISVMTLQDPSLSSVQGISVPTQVRGPIILSGDLLLEEIGFNQVRSIRLSGDSKNCIGISAIEGKAIEVGIRSASGAITIHRGTWTGNHPNASVQLSARAYTICMKQVSAFNLDGFARLTASSDQTPAGRSSSVLRQAAIQFLAIEHTLDLSEGEAFVLDDFHGKAEFRPAPSAEGQREGLLFNGSGTVGGLNTGVPGEEFDARPRYFDVLRSHYGIGGLLFCLVTCWGVVWGVVSFIQDRFK